MAETKNKMVLNEPDTFIQCMNAIKDLITDATFDIKKDGLYLTAIDPANVAMVVFKFKSSNFSTYDIEECKATIGIPTLLLMLKRTDKKSALTLELDTQLHLHSMNKYSKDFTMPLIVDSEDKQQKMPPLVFENSITTKTELFKEAIDDVEMVGEVAILEIANGKFIINGDGDLMKATTEFTDQVSGQDTKAKYAVEYLKKMLPKLSENVVIKFKKDYPMQLEYKNDKAELVYILAPRISD
jgi:proliferating cell nuclear antigen